MPADIVRKRILITGRVQGVGYRYFAVESAERLGVSGWARNLVDGRVEVEVEGPPVAVDRLIEELRVGPHLSKVTTLDIQDLDGTNSYKGFHVR
jgi:acylphosphatase